jgi:hypothetical protein
MAIVRMISRDVDEFRAFQTRSVEVGRIRTGEFATPEGKKGRPVKLDRFRLTSPKQEHIEMAAAEYGGQARSYQPQGGGAQQWEVITESNALDVYIVNGQLIDPVYEMWGAGRTCVRRCDGEWNAQTIEPCLCNDPERRPADPRQLCKITTRVSVMLPKVAGLHSWRLETHSENAALEMGAPTVSGLVRVARVPVPATLYLRAEQRRERNHDKGVFETKNFYVPTFHIPLSVLELAAGPEAITAALTAAGAPAVLGSQQPAIEAAPASAPPAPPAGPDTAPALTTGEPDPNGGVRLARDDYHALLQAIEGAADLARLDELRQKMIDRNVHYTAIKEAWASKHAGIVAAEALAVALADEPYLDRERTAARPCLDPYCANGPAACGFTPNEHLEAHGPAAILEEDRRTGRAPERHEYAVGDRVTVGGIEFTKISEGATIEDVFGREPLAAPDNDLNPDDPWAESGAPDSACHTLPDGSCASTEPCMHGPAIEGVLEGGDDLPVLPEGRYEVAEQWPILVTLAGQRTTDGKPDPWTLDQVRAAVVAAYGLGHIGEASGLQLARIAQALREGTL